MQKLHTLRFDLNLLILRHSLPEVLDRLYSMICEQSDLDQGQFAPQWNELVKNLEASLAAALVLAELKEAQSEDLWR